MAVPLLDAWLPPLLPSRMSWWATLTPLSLPHLCMYWLSLAWRLHLSTIAALDAWLPPLLPSLMSWWAMLTPLYPHQLCMCRLSRAYMSCPIYRLTGQIQRLRPRWTPGRGLCCLPQCHSGAILHSSLSSLLLHVLAEPGMYQTIMYNV